MLLRGFDRSLEKSVPQGFLFQKIDLPLKDLFQSEKQVEIMLTIFQRIIDRYVHHQVHIALRTDRALRCRTESMERTHLVLSAQFGDPIHVWREEIHALQSYEGRNVLFQRFKEIIIRIHQDHEARLLM